MTSRSKSRQAYLSINELAQRYGVVPKTVYRWMQHEKLPFPKPTLGGLGGQNRWAVEAVLQWEKRQSLADRKTRGQTHD